MSSYAQSIFIYVPAAISYHRCVQSYSAMSGVTVLRIIWFCCCFHNRSVKSCSTMSGVFVLRIREVLAPVL